MTGAGDSVLPGSANLIRVGFFFAATGRGVVVGLIVAASLLLSDWLTALYFHDSNYYAQHGWARFAAFLVAALVVWRLNGHGDETVAGSELDTGRKPFFTKGDTLFFAPAKHWPWILCGLGVLFYFWRG